MLQDAESNWQFDIFAFADATPGTTLSMLTWHLYKQAGLIRDFNLDEQKLCNFLQKIESGYSASNPYHNRKAPCSNPMTSTCVNNFKLWQCPEQSNPGMLGRDCLLPDSNQSGW